MAATQDGSQPWEGARNLADTDRYDLLPEIAKRLGLDTRSVRTMWRDRAMVELVRAVTYSFDADGVTMADHHSEAERFMTFLAKEEAAGRRCPADWSWIVPPMSGSQTPVFHRYYADRAVETVEGGCQSRIEGIGRARVEPSFEPGVIDRMIAVHDADSLGAMFALSKTLGRKVGGSTGTNLFACLQLIEEMASAGQTGSIVTLLCDDGARYASTYYSEEWLAEWGGNWRPAYERMLEILE